MPKSFSEDEILRALALWDCLCEAEEASLCAGFIHGWVPEGARLAEREARDAFMALDEDLQLIVIQNV